MLIYLAAPLFNEMELERNRELRDFLRGLGHEVYLPQEDGGLAFDLIAQGADMADVRRKVFAADVEAVRRCDILLCVLDGRVPDEGLCVELGMAYTLGKTCIGYQTDKRSLDKFGNNLMIDGCLKTIVHTKEELKDALT
jgi:nucleoside 2-deoxyribosyltransferase